MSLTPLEALRLVIQDRIPKLNYYQYPTLMLLPKEDEFQESIKWDVDAGGETTGGRATNAVNAIDASEGDMVGAALPIGLRTMGSRVNHVVTKIVQARNTGPGALANLFSYDMKTRMEKLFTDLNELIFTGDGSTASHGVYGLQYVTDPANVAYAGISSATYPLWNPTRLDNGGTGRALTRDLMSKMNTAILTSGGNYDVIITSYGLLEKYDKIFADSNQTAVSPMGFIDLGFQGYSYMGRPIIGDIACPPGEMYFLNSRGIELRTFNLSGSTESSIQTDSSKSMGVNIKIGEIRNENPDVLSWEIGLKPQLQVVNRRKSVAVLADLNE